MDDPDTFVSNASARIGQVLRNKWRILRCIGDGGTSEVFEAVHRNGKRGAVKLLRHELVKYPEAIERFLHEGLISNLVHHPGIVAALDDDRTEDGVPYLVMELLEGETIDEKLARLPESRMDPHEVCRLGVALLDVLAAVHAAGILHRDLKPDNLYLTNEGRLKLLDFGIAWAQKAPGTHKARLGVAMGTPGYMPVEQAAGDWESVDERTDLWAAGAVLFRMLTGNCVYEENTVAESLFAAMSKGAPPVGHRAPRVPAKVAAVVDKALQAHPGDRWQSAAEMRDALEVAMQSIEAEEAEWFAAKIETVPDSFPPSVRTPTPVQSWLTTPPTRRSAAWAGVSVIIAASAMLLGFAGVRMTEPHRDAFAPAAAATAGAHSATAGSSEPQRNDAASTISAATSTASASAKAAKAPSTNATTKPSSSARTSPAPKAVADQQRPGPAKHPARRDAESIYKSRQ